MKPPLDAPYRVLRAGFMMAAAGLAGALAHAGGLPVNPAVKLAEFLNEKAPYPQCHASTIVEAEPGRLVAAWFGGTREGAPDVGIWLSRHDGKRWLPATEVADGGQPDGTRHPTWNPVLFKAPRGPLFLFYKVGPSPSDWWGMLKTSSDGGRTWSEARRLPAPLLGPIKNKPVVLRDGSWLSASSTEGTPMGWRAHFEVSRDAGETWEFVGPLDKGVSSLEAIQGSVLFHRDGRLQALLRTRNGVLATTWSSDSGRTWSALAPSGLPNPNAGTDAITLKDGRQLLVYNHAAPAPGTTSGPRYPLNVAVSTDGVAWPMVLTLEAEPIPDGYAYPAVIQSADGLVHVTYTWNRRRIKHVVIDPRELAQDGQNQQCDPVGPRRGALDLVGIPAFQWIQAPIDYSTRVHHTNMDVFDHLVPEDLIQSAVITASFVYHAAMRDEMLPRKPLPASSKYPVRR
jgi:predicted neuraminidase